MPHDANFGGLDELASKAKARELGLREAKRESENQDLHEWILIRGRFRREGHCEPCCFDSRADAVRFDDT